MKNKESKNRLTNLERKKKIRELEVRSEKILSGEKVNWDAYLRNERRLERIEKGSY